jgi:hypothetical protein
MSSRHLQQNTFPLSFQACFFPTLSALPTGVAIHMELGISWFLALSPSIQKPEHPHVWLLPSTSDFSHSVYRRSFSLVPVSIQDNS